MSLIMGQIEPEHLELFALECGKIAEFDFVYTLAEFCRGRTIAGSVLKNYRWPQKSISKGPPSPLKI